MSQDSSNQPHLDTPQPEAPPPPPVTPPPADYTSQSPLPGLPTKEERNWAMFAHLSALIFGLVTTPIGLSFLAFLGPLIIYLMKRDESGFVADQAKEALNFYISVGIILLGLLLLSFTVILLVITVPAVILVSIGALVLSIIAAVKSSNGELYRYPFSLRLIN